MTDYREEIDRLELSAEGLASSAGQAATMVSEFDARLKSIRESAAATNKDVATLEKGLSGGLRKAFDGLVFDGASLTDAFETLAQSMIRTTYNAAMRPITNHFGGMLAQGVGRLFEGVLPFADGAPFSAGRVMPFATGGIVSSTTPFGMRGGMGIMGEAGPEAIMPLARGADGKLGVRTAGGGSTTVVMNISTPDAASFQRSQSQLAAQMSRALGRAQRNR